VVSDALLQPANELRLSDLPALSRTFIAVHFVASVVDLSSLPPPTHFVANKFGDLLSDPMDDFVFVFGAARGFVWVCATSATAADAASSSAITTTTSSNTLKYLLSR
jgi:hypothetical protein